MKYSVCQDRLLCSGILLATLHITPKLIDTKII